MTKEIKKRKDKWLQVGNFLLGLEKNSTGRFLVCKGVAGNWSVRWREDSLMFATVLNAMKVAVENSGVREYLHTLVSMMFMATGYMHDLVALSTKHQMPFCEGVAKLLKEQNDFELSLSAKPTAEQDENALQEVVELRQVEEELERLDEENG